MLGITGTDHNAGKAAQSGLLQVQQPDRAVVDGGPEIMPLEGTAQPGAEGAPVHAQAAACSRVMQQAPLLLDASPGRVLAKGLPHAKFAQAGLQAFE